MSGLFVVLEGGEGAGKTTLAAHLQHELGQSGREVVFTREPGGTDLGAGLRQMLLHTPDLDTTAQVLLFAADRAQHVAQVIAPALARGAIVICDRYVDSSIAYQGAAGADEGAIRAASDIATGGLTPDLTIVLDVDAATRRARRGDGTDVFERKDDAFHERIRRTFLDLASEDPGRYRVLPADLPAHIIAETSAAEIRDRLDVAPHTEAA